MNAPDERGVVFEYAVLQLGLGGLAELRELLADVSHGLRARGGGWGQRRAAARQALGGIQAVEKSASATHTRTSFSRTLSHLFAEVVHARLHELVRIEVITLGYVAGGEKRESEVCS